jgi:putative ABC transport system permease protein
MMRGTWAAIRTGLLDLRGDLRRFVLLLVCLAVGTALIGGVNAVGASITSALDRNAAVLMGGDLELSRADRPATADELALLQRWGNVAAVVDTNVRAAANGEEAFVDLAATSAAYPLLGEVVSPALVSGIRPAELLAVREGIHGALPSPLLLEQLGLAVGDTFDLGGAVFEVRGTLGKLPDGPVRGFRLGLTTLITLEGLAELSDRTSPLPGLGNWFRYKLLLDGADIDAVRSELEASLGASGWTVRTAIDGLGPMVRYYDLFMRFLVIVGLGSLLIGGVSVWTGMRAYIAERSGVIAVMRSLGASRARVFLHFFAQVAALAAVGVGAGLLIGGVAAFLVLPAVGAAVGIDLPASLHPQPLLIAAGAGFLTAFAFAYLPLQQAQAIRPVLLFRAKGLAAPPIDWAGLLLSIQILPLLLAGAAFFWLATLMTGDTRLVAAFAGASAVAAFVFQAFTRLAQAVIERLPSPRSPLLRTALRGVGRGSANAVAVVVAVGMALAMLIVVLVLQANLRQEFLGASAFDVPSLVASDLFPDEVETLAAMASQGGPVTGFIATPMLRGALVAIRGTPIAELRTRGPEATFLLSGDVPLTYRNTLPASSRVVAGDWWVGDYAGPPLLSLHQSLRSGLGVELGDEVTFEIFGEPVTAIVASFRDYSWQGGIDFLATFSPGALDAYPTTLFATVDAPAGGEQAAEVALAERLPDIRFIAVGDTLRQITDALSQLSFAAALVGGLAVGNGLLVLIGSLATGRRQREADTVITRVLGATGTGLLAAAAVQHGLLALMAAVPATALGIGMGWLVSQLLLDVDFVLAVDALVVVLLVAVAVTALLGAMTILRAANRRPARLLRDL